jgi:hypothetical protein
VNDELPVAVGVPEISPDDAPMLNPAGSAPAEMPHVYGVDPPLADTVVEYVRLTVPPGSDEVEMVGSAGATIEMLSAFVPVLFFESLTCTVNEEFPPTVGVPEITPDAAVRLKPAGSTPAVMLHVYGVVPPVAASVVE